MVTLKFIHAFIVTTQQKLNEIAICILDRYMRKYKKNVWNVEKDTQTYITSRDIKENGI